MEQKPKAADMPVDHFTRPTESVDRALVMASSRRTQAVNELNKASTDVELAERALLQAEQARLMRERHVELCDKQVTGLLDERLRSVEPEQVAEHMVQAGS